MGSLMISPCRAVKGVACAESYADSKKEQSKNDKVLFAPPAAMITEHALFTGQQCIQYTLEHTSPMYST